MDGVFSGDSTLNRRATRDIWETLVWNLVCFWLRDGKLQNSFSEQAFIVGLLRLFGMKIDRFINDDWNLNLWSVYNVFGVFSGIMCHSRSGLFSVDGLLGMNALCCTGSGFHWGSRTLRHYFEKCFSFGLNLSSKYLWFWSRDSGLRYMARE